MTGDIKKTKYNEMELHADVHCKLEREQQQQQWRKFGNVNTNGGKIRVTWKEEIPHEATIWRAFNARRMYFPPGLLIGPAISTGSKGTPISIKQRIIAIVTALNT